MIEFKPNAVDPSEIDADELRRRELKLYSVIDQIREVIQQIDTDLKKVCGCTPGRSYSEANSHVIEAPSFCAFHRPVVMN